MWDQDFAPSTAWVRSGSAPSADTPPKMNGDALAAASELAETYARLNTGLMTKVPQHMSVGDRVKIDTRDGSFVERV